MLELWVALYVEQCAVLPPISSAFNSLPLYFDRITGSLIHSIVLYQLMVLPSNIDAHGWHCVCTSYHSVSADLCNALASIA